METLFYLWVMNETNTHTMNKVKTTKIYPGVYNVQVTTPSGQTFNVKCENIKEQVETSNGYVWHIQEQSGQLDFCCGAWHQTKREALQFLKQQAV